MGRGVPENTQRRASLWVLKNPPVSEHKTDFEVRVVVSCERVAPTWEVRPECLVKVKGECVPETGTLGQGSPTWGWGLFSPCTDGPHPLQCHRNVPYQSACPIHSLPHILASTSR